MAPADVLETFFVLPILAFYYLLVWRRNAKEKLGVMYNRFLLGLGGLAVIFAKQLILSIETDTSDDLDTTISDLCDLVGFGLVYSCCIMVLVFTQQKAEERGRVRWLLCYLAPFFLAFNESFEAADDATSIPSPLRLAPTFSVLFESLLYASLILATLLSIIDRSTRGGCTLRVGLTIISLVISFLFFVISVIVYFQVSSINAEWYSFFADIFLLLVPLLNLIFVSDFDLSGKGADPIAQPLSQPLTQPASEPTITTVPVIPVVPVVAAAPAGP